MRPEMVSTCSSSQMRMSVATWSFLERPVWSFPVNKHYQPHVGGVQNERPTSSRSNQLSQTPLVGGVNVLVRLDDLE